MVDKEGIFNAARDAIVKDELFFITDVFPYLPCSVQTFYNYFPEDSDERKILQRYLDQNRIKVKLKLRKKMYTLDNPTTIIALYKLIATDEERAALSKTSSREPVLPVITEEKSISIIIENYRDKIIATLKQFNRYSAVMDTEIDALASAMSTLNAAERIISTLPSPFIVETTSQGTKQVEHPVFALQKKALDSVAQHSKLLGLDYENSPVSEETPIADLTRQLIDVSQKAVGRIEVKKTRRKR